MHSLSLLFILGAYFAFLIGHCFTQSVQFYQPSAGIKLVLSTTSDSTSTDLLFQLSAPQNAGWAAVGVGNQMAGSLMFILVPDGVNNATVSVRTASGEQTPALLSGIDYAVTGAGVNGTQMYANVHCRGCSTWSGGSLDTSSKSQPWIWALGPGGISLSGRNRRSAPGADIQIQQHASYGSFSMDMTAARSVSNLTTVSTFTDGISSTANSGTTAGDSRPLVFIHAFLLGVSFVVLFPLGIIILRLGTGSFKAHWLLQTVASLFCIVGLAVATARSAMSGEYVNFSGRHEIIGIAVVAGLFAQIVFGFLHHRQYKQVARRTWISHAHIWTGHIIVLVGMVDTVLGFLLSGSSSAAGFTAIASGIIILITGSIVILDRIKKTEQANLIVSG